MMENATRAITSASGSGIRLSRVLTIAWREFRHTVFTKGFIIGALAFPMVMFGVIGLMPFLLSDRPTPVHGTLVVADEDGSVAEAMESAFAMDRTDRATGGDPADAHTRGPFEEFDPDAADALAHLARVNITVKRVDIKDDLTAHRTQVQAGELLGLVEVPAALLSKASPEDLAITLLVPTDSPAKTTALIERVARDATVVARVERHGGDLAATRALLRRPEASTSRLSDEGDAAREDTKFRFILPGAFMMLMWIAAFTSANQLLTTTIEEKSSKVIEVLLSAASPLELLTGKILGQSAVSALMLSTYGVAGLFGLALAAMTDLVPLSTILLFLVWFVMGYLMVAAIMTAVGSAVSDLREAQSLVQPAMIVMMVPLILWLPITENPTGWLATIAGFIPPCGPFVMVLRTTGAVEPIPAWQVVAALGVNAAGTLLLVWAAARIFRVGVLMQGKPPSPRELIRWARAR